MIAVLDPAEVVALEESIRQTDVIHGHSDRWQDAYQSAMSAAEAVSIKTGSRAQKRWKSWQKLALRSFPAARSSWAALAI